MSETRQYRIRIIDRKTGEVQQDFIELTDEEAAEFEALGADLGRGAAAVVAEHRKKN